MDIVFIVDFDGTITKEDTCYAMLNKFATQSWEELDKLWSEGQLSTEQCSTKMFELMDLNEEKLREFIYSLDADITFGELLGYCEKEKYPVHIVSDGFDFNIEIILKKYNWDVGYYSNHLHFEDNGYILGFPYQEKECGKCGTCKTNILNKLKGNSRQVIYIGDGHSDKCPVEYADAVFAKGELLEYCRKQGIPALEYSNFKDILVQLKDII